jgi:hypothetical protein
VALLLLFVPLSLSFPSHTYTHTHTHTELSGLLRRFRQTRAPYTHTHTDPPKSPQELIEILHRFFFLPFDGPHSAHQEREKCNRR